MTDFCITPQVIIGLPEDTSLSDIALIHTIHSTRKYSLGTTDTNRQLVDSM